MPAKRRRTDEYIAASRLRVSAEETTEDLGEMMEIPPVTSTVLGDKRLWDITGKFKTLAAGTYNFFTFTLLPGVDFVVGFFLHFALSCDFSFRIFKCGSNGFYFFRKFRQVTVGQRLNSS